MQNQPLTIEEKKTAFLRFIAEFWAGYIIKKVESGEMPPTEKSLQDENM